MKNDKEQKLEQILKDYAESDLGDKTYNHDTDKGDVFQEFIIKKLVQKLYCPNVEIEDIKDFSFRGKERLIDFLIEVDSSHVILGQVEYSYDINKFDGTKKIVELLDDKKIRNKELKKRINELGDLTKRKYQILYFTADSLSEDQINSFGEISENFKNEKVEALISDRSAYDINMIFEELDNISGKKLRLPKKPSNLKLVGNKDNNMLKVDSFKPAYLVTSTAESILNNLKIKQPYFSFNVREGLGLKNDKSVNSNIKKTALNEAQKFFLFNNGLTILCSKIEENGDSLDIHQMQIINGAQTSTTLKDINNAGYEPDKVLVQIKIICWGEDLNSLSKDDKRIVENIVRATNSQNGVNTFDYESNEPYHEPINNYVQKQTIVRGNTNKYTWSFWYKWKRGIDAKTDRKRKFKSVDKKILFKRMGSLHISPFTINDSNLLSTDISNKDSIVNRYFMDDKGVIYDENMPKQAIMLIASNLFLSDFIDLKLKIYKAHRKKDTKHEQYFAALKRGQAYRFTVGEIIRNAFNNDDKIVRKFYLKFSDLSWYDNTSDIRNQVISDVCATAETILLESMDDYIQKFGENFDKWNEDIETQNIICLKTARAIKPTTTIFQNMEKILKNK